MLVRRLVVPAPEGVQPGPEVQSFQLRIDVMSDTYKSKRAKVRAAIRRLVAAEINDAFRGAAHPDEWVYIDAELKAAKQHMTKVLSEVL